MKKLTECELKSVDKPGRYVGGEYGETVKDKDKIRYNIALCYPNLYENGMSSTVFCRIYNYLNGNSDIYSQRVFMPNTDFEKLLIYKKIKIYSLESKQELNEFNSIVFIVENMMTLTNIFTMLKLGGVEPFRDKRTSDSVKIVGVLGHNCNSRAFENIFDNTFTIGDVNYLEKLEKVMCGMDGKLHKLKNRGYINGLVPSISIIDDSIKITNDLFEKFDTNDILTILKENIKKQGINKISFSLHGKVNETKLSNLIFGIKKEITKCRLILKDMDFINLTGETLKIILPYFEKSQITYSIVSMNYEIRKKYLSEITMEQIVSKVFIALNLGYTNIKFNFTIGFAKETYKDLDDIINFANEIIGEFSKSRAREKINIEICLKYFQERKATLNFYHKIEMKYKYLKEKELGTRITINILEPQMSIIENILLYCDKDILTDIEYAWKKGARFDYNPKLFNENIWDSIIAKRILNLK